MHTADCTPTREARQEGTHVLKEGQLVSSRTMLACGRHSTFEHEAGCLADVHAEELSDALALGFRVELHVAGERRRVVP